MSGEAEGAPIASPPVLLPFGGGGETTAEEEKGAVLLSRSSAAIEGSAAKKAPATSRDSESTSDEDCMVHVKAQVMVRDDSKGGWVPMGGGGMSIIGLCRVVTSGRDEPNVEFLIYGRRISDKSVVLKCVLKKDFQYTWVNPTFHHWRTEGKKFGLTFHSTTDARIFERGVKRAVECLKEGSTDKSIRGFKAESPFMSLSLPMERTDSISRPESTASTTVSTPSSHPSPTSPIAPSPCPPCPTPSCPSPCPPGPPPGQPDPRVGPAPLAPPRWYSTFPQLSVPRANTKKSVVSLPDFNRAWARNHLNLLGALRGGGGAAKGGGAVGRPAGVVAAAGGGVDTAIDPYVQFGARPGHPDAQLQYEYSYPQLIEAAAPNSPLPAHGGRPPAPPPATPPPSASSRRRDPPAITPPTPQGAVSPLGGPGGNVEDRPTIRLLARQRLKCIHCQEMYVAEENRAGSCVDAPDPALACIERVSCMCCAHALLYHCVRDSDGARIDAHPCEGCGRGGEEGGQGSGSRDCRRWAAVALLSLVVPCLWCYLPLAACHGCAVGCRCCGGRHAAM